MLDQKWAIVSSELYQSGATVDRLCQVICASQLVFCVTQPPLVAVEVEHDTMSGRTHVVHTREALDLTRMFKPRTLPSTVPEICCFPRSNTRSPVADVYTRRVSLSLLKGSQESRQQELPISQHHCRCQSPRHPRSWIRSCSSKKKPLNVVSPVARLLLTLHIRSALLLLRSIFGIVSLTVAVPAFHILLVFVRLLLGVGRGLVLAVFALTLVLGLVSPPPNH